MCWESRSFWEVPYIMLWHSKMYQGTDIWEYATGECIVCWEARACVAISPCGHKFWKVPSIVPLYHMLHHGTGFWEYAAGMHSEKYPLSCFYIVTVLGLWRLRICGSCRAINSENCPLSCFYTVTILGHWRLRICGRHVCLCECVRLFYILKIALYRVFTE